MAKTVDMTTGRPLRLMISFALPLMFGNIFQQLYTVTDTAIIGRGVGILALASLGIVEWLNFMLVGTAQGFSQGFSVHISQKFGEHDYDGMRRAIARSAVLSMVLAVVIALAGELLLDQLLDMMNTPAELRPMAIRYSRIIVGGIPCVMFYNFCAAVLRAVGDSKTPLYAMVAASLVNICLDLLAVFVLGWGIVGAAAATVFSQMLSGIYCARKLYQSSELHFGREELRQSRDLTMLLLKLGTPIAILNLIIAFGGVKVQAVVDQFDTAFIAGFTATAKLYGLLEIAAISYGFAVTTFVGQNMGAGKVERIRQGTRTAALLSIATASVIGGLMLIFGRQITGLFIAADSPELAAAAGKTAFAFLKVMASCLPILYLLYTFRSALQGMENTVIPMLSGVAECAVRLGVASYMERIHYANGLFWAEVGAWTGAEILLMIAYFVVIAKKEKQQ